MLCVSILIAGSLLGGYFVTKEMYIEWDSMRYLLVAEEIGKGNGAISPLIWFEGGPSMVKDGKAPLTEQPPGYPAIIAGLNKLFHDSVLSVRIVNLVSHVLIGLIVMVTAYHFAPLWISFVSALALTFSLPMLFGVLSAWPEYIFTFAVLASVYCIVESGSARRHRNGWWFGAAAFAAMAIGLRYAGIFLIPVLSWEALRKWRYSRISVRQTAVLLSGPLLPAAVFLIFLLRNYFYTGSMRGFSQPPPERSLMEAFEGVYRLFFAMFGIEDPARMIGISVVLATAVLIVAWLLRKPASSKETFSRVWKSGLEPVIFAAAAYFGFIVLIMFRNQPVFEQRFLYPVVPILFAAFAGLVGWMYSHAASGKWSRGKIAALLFTAGLSCGTFALTVRHFDMLYQQPSAENALKDSKSALGWLEKNPQVKIVATNLPFVIAYHSRRSVLRLPQRYHNPWFRIPEDMESALPRRMKEVGAEYLILVGKNLDGKYWGEFISSLSNCVSGCNLFTLIDSSPTSKIFKLGRLKSDSLKQAPAAGSRQKKRIYERKKG